jgi:CheY-like chemotaxis protein
MKKILLAEHDSFLINVYANELRKSDYNITIAPNGDIVVNRIKDIRPDLLILDINLPGSEDYPDGLSVLEKVREEMGLRELKVVMLFNFDKDEVKKSYKFGVEKYFAKAENTAEEIAREIKRILS